MREIKFRIYDHEQKKMILPNSGQTIIISDNGVTADTEKWSVMQFTGLKDSKGIMIFEGDILKFNGEVKYEVGGAGGTDTSCYHIGFEFDEINTPDKDEIIGNIYQDSHLLDKGVKE